MEGKSLVKINIWIEGPEIKKQLLFRKIIWERNIAKQQQKKCPFFHQIRCCPASISKSKLLFIIGWPNPAFFLFLVLATFFCWSWSDSNWLNLRSLSFSCYFLRLFLAVPLIWILTEDLLPNQYLQALECPVQEFFFQLCRLTWVPVPPHKQMFKHECW